jgi:hypothetical protein
MKRSRLSTESTGPLQFKDNDLQILSLLASRALIRAPWSYQYLTGEYIEKLLGRSAHVRRRLQKMCEKDKRFLEHVERPANIAAPLIYTLAARGEDKLTDAGFAIPAFHPRKLPHELMACIIAASFEVASQETNTPISVQQVHHAGVVPDWHVFRFGTSPSVYIEADMASESLRNRANATTIEEKFEHYLKLIDEKRFKHSIVLFYTLGPTRMDSMVERLKYAIDKHDYPHEYAEQFGFTFIHYDRYLDHIPKPSPWAAHIKYVRAGAEFFSFEQFGAE